MSMRVPSTYEQKRSIRRKTARIFTYQSMPIVEPIIPAVNKDEVKKLSSLVEPIKAFLVLGID